jgi:hypothetical protein
MIATARLKAMRRSSLCLGALLLLVVNDHLLKPVWPCWITGIFLSGAAFVATAPTIPRRLRWERRRATSCRAGQCRA